MLVFVLALANLFGVLGHRIAPLFGGLFQSEEPSLGQKLIVVLFVVGVIAYKICANVIFPFTHPEQYNELKRGEAERRAKTVGLLGQIGLAIFDRWKK